MLLGTLLLAALALPGAADVVHLKAGGTLEGEVTETENDVIVRLPAGEVRLPRQSVLRIERKPSVMQEYGKRAAALQHDDTAGHYELGVWARQQGLETQARAHFQTVIALDPNHAGAREALGYRLVEGRWMTEADEMRARGLVFHDGQWMSPEAAAKLKALEAQLEIAKEERRKAEAELDQAKQQPKPSPYVYGVNPYDQYYANQAYTRSRVYYPYYSTYSYGYPAYGVYRSTYRHPSYFGWAYWGYRHSYDRRHHSRSKYYKHR
jgi:hypothetical protein